MEYGEIFEGQKMKYKEMKKYEPMIHKFLKNKFNLINQEEYEDLVQEGRKIILEGMKNKYDSKRASVCTFLYLYLESRFFAMNVRKGHVYHPKNIHNRVPFTNQRSFEDTPLPSGLVKLDSFLSGEGIDTEYFQNLRLDFQRLYEKMTPHQKVIFHLKYVEGDSSLRIAKKLGYGRTKGEVDRVLKIIDKSFKEIV